MLDLGIDLNVWPWIWLVTAVVFALVEVTLIGGTFILAPFAISAFVASLLGFYDVPVTVQWSVFVFGGAAMFALLYRWANRFVSGRDLPPGVGADRLVGMIGTVTDATPDEHSPQSGKVAVEGEVWRAVSEGDAQIPSGAIVEIVAVRGTRLVVRTAPRPATEQETP